MQCAIAHTVYVQYVHCRGLYLSNLIPPEYGLECVCHSERETMEFMMTLEPVTLGQKLYCRISD